MPTSPMIEAALKDGRDSDDIMIVFCDACGNVSYYNQGSHCSCEHCDANLDHLLGEDGYNIITLEDFWGSVDIMEAG